MPQILFINACVRPESRTLRLARHILDRLDGTVETLDLQREQIPPLDNATLEYRIARLEAGRTDDPLFAYARQFAAADEIVIAAPYWDLSFPASLKTYIEAINVLGITFDFDERGVAHGRCRARRLIYVTTAGGPILDDQLGYGYIQTLCRSFYGIPETLYVKAEGLDVIGAPVESLLTAAAQEADRLLGIS